MKSEIRIASIGNVDSAKTTTISVIANNNLDDGKGKARKLIMKHPHEQKTGRTSSITQHYIEIKDKIIGFIDLAGHEKYLKTTVTGLNGSFIDYVMFTIGADRGIAGMTKEHLTLAIALKLPIYIVITKIDIAYKHKLDKIRLKLSNIFNHPLAGKKELIFVNNVNIQKVIDTYNCNCKFIPIFEISNITGENIDNLKKFVFSLPKTNIFGKIENKNPIFKIDDVFKLDGLGIVLSGVVSQGKVYTNMEINIGPFNGKFIPVIIKSIHNNFKKSISELYSGQCGCLNIKVVQPKKHYLVRSLIKRGCILTLNPYSIKKFDARIKILHHPTTICKKYEPVIHCGSVRQTAKICHMDKQLVRTGDCTNVTFEFKFKPEFIELNKQLVFREGNTKGIGIVTKIY